MSRKWTKNEDMLIQDYYLKPINRYMPPTPIAQLTKKFKQLGFNRSQDAIRNRIYILRRRYWMGSALRRQSWLEGARFGYLDIETVKDFAANFGQMCSWAMYIPNDSQEWNYKFIDKKSTAYRATPMGVEDADKEGRVVHDAWRRSEAVDWKKFDKRITRSLIRALDDVDIVVTYWGTGFDVKYVRSRALFWNLRFPKYQEKLHLDLYYSVRGLLKLGRNSLEQATQFFGIEGKTHVRADMWNRAQVGDPEAMEYVVNHNIEDVKILACLHNRIGGFRNITRRSL